jgi:hypothetical protein
MEKPNILSLLKISSTKPLKIFDLNRSKHDNNKKTKIMTIRMSQETKYFYQCLAESESKSLQATLLDALEMIKDTSYCDYKSSYNIEDQYKYNVNSIMSMIEGHHIDTIDLPKLLSYVTKSNIKASDLISTDYIINLLDRQTIEKLCFMFGYSWKWVKDNSERVYFDYIGSRNRFYKNTTSFIQNIIYNFYVKEHITNLRLSFITNDNNIIDNIQNDIYRAESKDFRIIPFLKVENKINDIEFTTYHILEAQDINYDKVRKHFIELVNMTEVLRHNHILSYSDGFYISDEEIDKIQKNTHLSKYFTARNSTISFYPDDLIKLSKNPKLEVSDLLSLSIFDSIIMFKNIYKESTITHNNDEYIIINNDLLNFINKENSICCERGMPNLINSTHELKKLLYLYTIKDENGLERHAPYFHQINNEEFICVNSINDYLKIYKNNLKHRSQLKLQFG